jgi:hypothetical protein
MSVNSWPCHDWLSDCHAGVWNWDSHRQLLIDDSQIRFYVNQNVAFYDGMITYDGMVVNVEFMMG